MRRKDDGEQGELGELVARRTASGSGKNRKLRNDQTVIEKAEFMYSPVVPKRFKLQRDDAQKVGYKTRAVYEEMHSMYSGLLRRN